MEVDRVTSCRHCKKTEEDASLYKCPMCHQMACDDCGYRRAGKFFCQLGCADEFFFGDVDEEDADN